MAEIANEGTRQELRYLDLDVAESHVVIFALQRFKLDSIVSDIKTLFYHLPSQTNSLVWPTDISAAQETIRQKLESWNAEVSELSEGARDEDRLEEIIRTRCCLKLRSQYYAAMVLLFQPSQVVPQPQDENLLLCYNCATERLKCYSELYNMDGLFFSWRSVQGIFSAGATMIYCLWTSSKVRSSVGRAGATKSLRNCDNLLSAGGEWWPSVRKGKESFGRAMEALLRLLDAPHLSTAIDRSDAPQPQIRRLNAELNLGNTLHVASSMVHGTNDTLLLDTSLQDHGTTWRMQSDMHDQLPFDVNNPNIYHQPLDAFQYPSFTEADLMTTDPTLDAFVAEFMDNGTSWNIF